MSRYRKIFEDSRGKVLQYKKFKPDLPSNIFSQIFIQQLVKIEDLAPHEDEVAIEYTTYKLQFSHYLRRWLQTGELVSDDIEALHDDVKARWRTEHRTAHKDCKPTEILKAAQNVLTTMRREKFQLGVTQLNTQMSNGELYNLSDQSEIGWHKDWDK